MTIIVAAVGAISEIFSDLLAPAAFGHRTIAGSIVAFARARHLAWMQNMYSAPIPDRLPLFAMLCAAAALVPIGLIVFNWIGTLRGGDVGCAPPLRFALGAAALTDRARRRARRTR